MGVGRWALGIGRWVLGVGAERWAAVLTRPRYPLGALQTVPPSLRQHAPLSHDPRILASLHPLEIYTARDD